MPRCRAALLISSLLLFSHPVSAQDPPVVQPAVEDPIGPYVLDARGAMARFKEDASVGASLGVDANLNLPSRGFGLAVGAHVYPVRRRSFALGLGAELLLRAQASRTAPPATENGPEGPTVETRMSAVSPQVSLNFGKRQGYSYISGGFGWASLTSERVPASSTAVDDGDSRQAINYGGGARWFTNKHIAVSIDLRFYGVSAREATATVPAYPSMTVMVISAGISAR